MKRTAAEPVTTGSNPEPGRQAGGEPDRTRSLARGIDLLRAFRPGADLLGNGELAERTGLSRATVSRLCATLVDAGMLDHDRSRRAYRLAGAVLSLAHAMRSGSPVLAVAGPLIRQEAFKRRINVGLAIADRDDMVYLESVRYSHRVALRTVVAGQRVPVELTSLGRAWLASLADEQRHDWLDRCRRRRRTGWRGLSRDIAQAVSDVHQLGYCHASWQPQVVALACPVVVAGYPVHVVNISVTTEQPAQQVVAALHRPLLQLAARIGQSLADP